MTMNINNFFASVFLFVLSISASLEVQAFFGPRNFEDCVLEGAKEAKTDQAANLIETACRKKFPAADTTQNQSSYDLPDHRKFTSFGMNRPTLNQLISKLQINQLITVQTGSNTYGIKSYDYGHHLSVELTNRNDFNITGIELSIPKKAGNCSWENQDYNEIYSCSGAAPAWSSGVFRCEIPRIETRRIQACITGFFIYTNQAGADSFRARFNIPARPKKN